MNPISPRWLTAFAFCTYLSAGTPRTLGAATIIHFDSQPGDYIGQGKQQTFEPVDGYFSASRNFDQGISISYNGTNNWSLNFAAPGDVPLTIGTYTGVMRYPFQNASSPGLDVSGAGRGCNSLTGQFDVTDVAYGAGGAVERFAATFEQHCEGRAPALFGDISFDLATARATPAEIAEATRLTDAERARLLAFSNQLSDVATGIYMYSETGDYIGQGRTYTFTPASGTIGAQRNKNGVNISYRGLGTDFWSYNFEAPLDLPFAAGDFGDATRFPFNSPTKPGLSISGAGRSSNQLIGDFLVLESVFGPAGEVERLDVIFEQHSEGATPALFGRVRYNASLPVPEPGAGVLCLLGFGVAAARRRRRS